MPEIRMGDGDDEWTLVGVDLAEHILVLADREPEFSTVDALAYLDENRGYDFPAIYQAYRRLVYLDARTGGSPALDRSMAVLAAVVKYYEDDGSSS